MKIFDADNFENVPAEIAQELQRLSFTADNKLQKVQFKNMLNGFALVFDGAAKSDKIDAYTAKYSPELTRLADLLDDDMSEMIEGFPRGAVDALKDLKASLAADIALLSPVLAEGAPIERHSMKSTERAVEGLRAHVFFKEAPEIEAYLNTVTSKGTDEDLMSSIYSD